MGKRKADVDSDDEVSLEPEDLDVEVCCALARPCHSNVSLL
jgi:hypothetical protein